MRTTHDLGQSRATASTSTTHGVAELMQMFNADDANVAWLLCDRHPAERVAFTVVDGDGGQTEFTYGELAAASHRYAHVLADLGVGPGDRVASLMGKGVDLVVSILATWRLGGVYVPLFTAFGSEAVAMRLARSNARVVITNPDQRHKIDTTDLPDLAVVLTEPSTGACDDALLGDLVAVASAEPIAGQAVGGSAPLVHMFTSGTTGKPKGVIHPVAYLAGWLAYLKYALAVTEHDVFWSAADPGWAYGLYTAIAAPMAAGHSSVLLQGGFSAESTWRTLSTLGVTNFAAAPTVYRSLRNSAAAVPSDLRIVRASSAGEPLTPEVNEWAETTLGLLVHDHFGQTEVGMVLANHHHPALAGAVKPGSMGRAAPGWVLTVLTDGTDELADAGVNGRVAIDIASSPLMTFSEYQEPAESADRFTTDRRYYLTGDTARMDADGDFFFSARDDDVIIMAGYRIGPFDVESVIAQHPAVAECCVIAAPDPVRGEVVEAFVVPRDTHHASADLCAEIQQLVKTRYAAHAYPRSVHFVEALPKTPSGKVQRYVLRQKRSGAVTSEQNR